MARLIDADALKERAIRVSTVKEHCYMKAVGTHEIDKAPTIDAVPVVRCKDCKHRGDDTYCPMCFEEEIEWDDDGYTEYDWIFHNRTIDEGFCDRGERKDDDST